MLLDPKIKHKNWNFVELITLGRVTVFPNFAKFAGFTFTNDIHQAILRKINFHKLLINRISRRINFPEQLNVSFLRNEKKIQQ